MLMKIDTAHVGLKNIIATTCDGNLSYFDDHIGVVDSTRHMLGFSTHRTRFWNKKYQKMATWVAT